MTALALSIGKRTILNGEEFNGFFVDESAVYSDYKVLKHGDVYDTVKFICKISKQYSGDTLKISKVLQGSSRGETVRNVHSFRVKYLQYDIEVGEKLRRPARTWHVGSKQNDLKTGNTGVDCDDMTIFSGSIFPR